MKNIPVFVAVGFISVSMLAGCDKTTEQKPDSAGLDVRDVKQELKADKTAFASEWQTFKNESEQTLQANQKRIDAFKAKMDKAGFKSKARYNKEVAVLEKSNADLKKKLDEYKDEGEGKWAEFKTGFKHDMDAVGKTMTDLFKDNG